MKSEGICLYQCLHGHCEVARVRLVRNPLSDLCLMSMEDHLPGLSKREGVGGFHWPTIHQYTTGLKCTGQDLVTHKRKVLQYHLHKMNIASHLCVHISQQLLRCLFLVSRRV